MYLRKVFENDHFIRLENVERDSITVYIEKNIAYILSISVSFPNRGMARGSELLYAMESCLYEKGIMNVNCTYSSKLLNVCDLLTVCGYSITDGLPAVVCSTDDLFASRSVQNAMNAGEKKDVFVPLSALNADSTGKLMRILKDYIKPLSTAYLTGFLQDESGVVFDDQNRIAAMILCTKHDRCLHIDHFILPVEGSPQYVGSLIAGFFLRILHLCETDPFDEISFIPNDKNEKKLAKTFWEKYENKGYHLSFDGIKVLSSPKKSFEIRDDEMMPENVFMHVWEKEVALVPFQYNMYLKK